MRYLTMLLLLVVALAGGCHIKMHDVVGSGVRQTQQRELPAFTSISMQGAFDIDVVCQKPQSFEIEGDDNLLPLITTEVRGNVLHIGTNKSFSVHEPIKIRIAAGNLEAISTNGAGSINVTGLKNDKFEIDANGATAFRVAGETKLIDIDTNGAGKIDAHKLRASRGVVDAKGVARVDVNVADQLDVTVSGPSHVTYQGDPVLNKTVHGPGSVDKKEAEVSWLVNRE